MHKLKNWPFARRIPDRDRTWKMCIRDRPVGVNMEKVPAADCTIHFHPKAGMEKNVKALHLEERYERHKATAHKYLLLRQQYDDAKVEEMVKMGMFPTKDFAYRVLYGEPLDEEAEEGI